MRSFLITFVSLLFSPWIAGGSEAALSGELKKWHKLTLRCPGPETHETAEPNPFRDYRLNATFTHPASGRVYKVPGYYAADGNAAETGATSGNIWHVHFAPDQTGTWNYSLSFRTGSDIVLDADPAAGVPAATIDGTTGSFEVAPSDKTGRDFRAHGRLEYVGKHHLRFAETGRFFMKCGTDSPENLLAYEDFEGTPDVRGRRKSWEAHQIDYDPAEAAPHTWQGGKGSELLGALRYLSDQGLNAFSFLTFSLDGDDDNVFPHLLVEDEDTFEDEDDDERWESHRVHHDRFDVSKLAQWEKIFSYATVRGLHLHFKTQEMENDELMDDPEEGIGPERTLYYRELVARFGHHLALNWNLGEEISNSDDQRIAFAQWFYDNDPYRHPIVMHTRDNSEQDDYEPMLGSESKLTGASLQPADHEGFNTVFPDTERWVTASAAEGRPWVVACDEPGDSTAGLRDDTHSGAAANRIHARKNALWGNPMAGGAGLEWYFGGSSNDHSDMTCEDFRSRAAFWPVCRHMLKFWESSGSRYWEMKNDNPASSNSNSHCLSDPGEQYVVYLKSGGSTNLDLSGVSGTFEVRWFDPRNGGELQQGSQPMVAAGAPVNLGTAPSAPTQDWVVLVQEVTGNFQPEFAGTSFGTAYQTPATLSIPKLLFTASDPEGHALSVSGTDPASTWGGTVTLGASTITYTPPAGFSGNDSFFITVSDELGASVSGVATVAVAPPTTGGGAAYNPPRIEISDGTVIIRFHAIPGFSYAIQRSVDLALWETIHTATAGPTGLLEHVDEDPPSPSAYYRLNTP